MLVFTKRIASRCRISHYKELPDDIAEEGIRLYLEGLIVTLLILGEYPLQESVMK